MMDYKAFRGYLSDSFISLETLVNDDLLLGVKPEDCGFDFDARSEIYDELGQTKFGYSMFSDTKNKFRDIVDSLPMRFFENTKNPLIDFNKSVRPSKIVYKREPLRRYIETYNKAVGRLAFLLHTIGGQPGRGTEFIQIFFSNMKNRVRNIYMLAPGQLIYVLFYNKTTSQTGYDRVVAHAIPWRLARLLLIVRALVTPFIVQIYTSEIDNDARAMQLHAVFAQDGVQMTSDQLSRILDDWFAENMHVNIGLRLYRQFVIAVQRRLMAAAFEVIKQILAAIDSQGGHSTETAEANYAILPEEAHMLNNDTIRKYVAVSRWWWRILFADVPDLLTPVERGQGEDAPAEFVDPAHQALITAQAEAIRTAMGEALQKGALGQQVATFLMEKFQGLEIFSQQRATPAMQLDPVYGPGPHRPYVTAPAERLFLAPKHLRLLRLYCKNQSASWTTEEQAQALGHIMGRQSSMLVVLPTGAGKSFLYAGMQYHEDAITVVVFPLKALLLDQIDTANRRNKNHPWVLWRHDLEVTSGIVVTSIESLDKDTFRHWCAAAFKNHRLARIVIDECHLIPSSVDCRKVMNNLKPLVEARVPLVCLTATMPPSLEPHLNYCIGHPTWKIVRAGTQQPNLHLRTYRYASQRDAMTVLELILARYMRTLGDDQSILIIVRTHAEAEELAALLGCPAYHKGMSDEQRAAVARAWLSGKEKLIVGTSALGTGVHHPGCVVVIHWNVPYGLLAYAQETGRAGRNGQPAICIMLFWLPYPEVRGLDLKGYAELRDMLDDDGRCIRQFMSEYLDTAALAINCFSGVRMELCGRCNIDMIKEYLPSRPVIPGLVRPRKKPLCQPANRLPTDLIAVGDKELQGLLSEDMNMDIDAPGGPLLEVDTNDAASNPETDNNELQNDWRDGEEAADPDDGDELPAAPTTSSKGKGRATTPDLETQEFDPLEDASGVDFATQLAHIRELEREDKRLAQQAGQSSHLKTIDQQRVPFTGPLGRAGPSLASTSRITTANTTVGQLNKATRQMSITEDGQRDPRGSSGRDPSGRNVSSSKPARSRQSFSQALALTPAGPAAVGVPAGVALVSQGVGTSPEAPPFPRPRETTPKSPVLRRKLPPAPAPPVSPTRLVHRRNISMPNQARTSTKPPRVQQPAGSAPRASALTRQSHQPVMVGPGPAAQQLSQATRELRPLEPIGPAVLRDAQESVDRRGAGNDPCEAIEEQAGIFNFPTVLAFKKSVKNWFILGNFSDQIRTVAIAPQILHPRGWEHHH
ncbi:hypothetical protein FRC12_006447 [Ceratobasidium sp. 428]|nr:hypothetical protein FRC12_006447 [Ceratobasidium sp. 428]